MNKKKYKSRVKTMLEPFASECRSKMGQSKISIASLAVQTGISTVTLGGILNNKIENVSLEILDKMAFALGIELHLI